MKRMQAFKFRLKTNTNEAQKLLRFAGCTRYVFNQALNFQMKRYEQGEKHLSYAGLCSVLTIWKKEKKRVWLNEAPSQSLQQSLKDLDRAYQNFFKKLAAFPCFKKRGIRISFRYPQGLKLDQARSRIFLPKLGWLKYKNSQSVLGAIKNVTVSNKAGCWFIAIQTEREIAEPKHPQTGIVGIDVGVKRLATLSTREIFPVNDTLEIKQKRLQYAQRQLSKKVKFSQNWKKQKKRIATLHHRIANTRLDHLHQASSKISKNHAMIVLEDLQIKNMTRSASGTIEKPGKNVKAKSGLNRAILNQGWGELHRQLVYKAKWQGGDVIFVDPKYTSQQCPECKTISKDNRKTQSDFACIACVFKEHADYVAALNILAAGHAVLACGGTVLLDRPMKQEPIRSATAV